MFRKIVFCIRLTLPIIFNIILFLIIYNYYKGEDFALTNSMFYVGVIGIIYGLTSLILFRREQHSFLWARRTLPIDIELLEEDIKNHPNEVKSNPMKIQISSSHISIIYIILGIILLLSSIISY